MLCEAFLFNRTHFNNSLILRRYSLLGTFKLSTIALTEVRISTGCNTGGFLKYLMQPSLLGPLEVYIAGRGSNRHTIKEEKGDWTYLERAGPRLPMMSPEL